MEVRGLSSQQGSLHPLRPFTSFSDGGHPDGELGGHPAGPRRQWSPPCLSRVKDMIASDRRPTVFSKCFFCYLTALSVTEHCGESRTLEEEEPEKEDIFCVFVMSGGWAVSILISQTLLRSSPLARNHNNL